MALISFAAIGLLIVLVGLVIPVGAASNDASRGQTAADAAALAGAEEARTQFVHVSTRPVQLQFPSAPLPPVIGGTGSSAAQTYASRNGADLREYTLSPSRGRVHAVVQVMRSSHADNDRARSASTVAMDVDFANCRWDDPLPPPPVPAGPPTFERTLECGRWSATYLVANAAPAYPTISYVGTTARELFRDLEPRIVD